MSRVKVFREVELSAPIMAWLEAQGFFVYTEVPAPYGAGVTDIIAVRPPVPTVIAVEMKMTLSDVVIRQGARAQLDADGVFCAVASNPRAVTLNRARRFGLGVLRVQGDSVAKLLSPEFGKHVWAPHKRALIRRLATWPTGGIAGLPTLKGCGPAQECAMRVRVYWERHPTASWADVFRDVANHYSNVRSMAGAMRMKKVWMPR